MTLPGIRLARTDGALGITPAATDAVNCLVGVSVSGEPYKLQSWTDPAAMTRALGGGPLAHAAATELDVVGQVYTLSVKPDLDSTIGTLRATWTSPGVSVSGTPVDDVQLRGIIIRGGALGAATWSYSLDGGNTYSPPVITAAKFPIVGAGLTVSFDAGTYNAGDSFECDCTAPTFSPLALVKAQAALLADAREWGLLHIIGGTVGADDGARTAAVLALAGAAGGIMQSLNRRFRYARALVDAPDVGDDVLAAAFATFADAGVLVGGGYHDLGSPIDGRRYKRPVGWSYAPRVATIAIQEHPGMVARGPLPSSVSRLYTEDPTALDDGRFVTLRAHVGLPGFYISRGPTMAAATSDYSEHQRCRVIDRTSKVGRVALLRWLNRDLEVKADGSLTDVQANTIDADLQRDLRAALLDTGAASAASSAVNRTADVETSSTLSGKFRVRPKGYASFIDWEIGFSPLVATSPNATPSAGA